MSESLLHCLGYGYKVLPTCDHYRELIELYSSETGEDFDEIREKYGQYTYDQWGKLLVAAMRKKDKGE